MEPLGRISLKNTKKTLSQSYCKIVCDRSWLIINRGDASQWHLHNFCMILYIYRSSHPKVFFVKGVLKICSKFTGEHPCWRVISIKLLALRHRCSSADVLYIFRTPFPRNTSGWVLLYVRLYKIRNRKIKLMKKLRCANCATTPTAIPIFD